MKIVVLNYSGSVGKTMATSHVFAPRIPEAEIIAVESTNESAADLGLDVEQMRGEQFGRLFRKLLMAESAIVDVGASNIEDFLAELIKYDDAHREVDYYVLPVVSSGKAQRETIKTIQALTQIGVPTERVRVLFNRVDADVKEEFSPIFGYAIQAGGFMANPEAAIFENEIFDLLANKRTTIKEILADETNYRQKLRETDRNDKKRISQLSDMVALQALARPVDRQLDQAFSALFV
ncbi:plasmid stability protein StbB [Achromobacter insolitus]|uniref:StbB family protein n=1 Tax=Achromobacter insolitus TaxID=217204 RepID=UPI0007C6E194|nr:StbB family protein [Achromobacter insolitus]OAE71679.1 plasmid stability protein StbB [Achromobacter insolitus]OCZ52915.1 plasmid stability protein StbB [Achromobacter insolitus]